MAIELTPTVGAILGGAVGLMGFAWLALKQKPLPEPVFNHHNIKGGASVAQSVAQVIDDGLTDKKPGGFFISELNDGTRLRFQQETGVLLFGGPGTGKGTCFILPTMLDRQGGQRDLRESIFCLDPAAQNLGVACEYLRSIGYRVEYINPTGWLDAELRARFGPPVQTNLLGMIDVRTAEGELAVIEIAAVFVPVHEGDSKPFFSGSAQDLTAATALWLCETRGESATWPQVADLIHQDPYRMNEMFAAFKKSRFRLVRAAGDAWHAEIDEKGKLRVATEGMRDVLSTARRELSFLLIQSIAEALGYAKP